MEQRARSASANLRLCRYSFYHSRRSGTWSSSFNLYQIVRTTAYGLSRYTARRGRTAPSACHVKDKRRGSLPEYHGRAESVRIAVKHVFREA